MDISPLLHALCAVAAQILVGLFTGNWAYGAIAGCTFFIAREHTQAEYRWIEMFGHGKRMNMPWWGGFDPRAWDVASLMDFAVPVVACLMNKTANKTTIVGAGALSIKKDNQTPVIDTITDMPVASRSAI